MIDNSGGGIFHFLPQAEALPEDEFEALLGTPTGLDPAEAARLFGLERGDPRDARPSWTRPSPATRG